MKVSVEQSRCRGHARCLELAPQVFGFDDEIDRSIVIDANPPKNLDDAVKNAFDNCPERAITIS